MAGPEYLICLECETPCYVFEWDDGRITEALCTVCGNDEVEQFMTQEELDDLGSE
jgi:hypothetical protein